MTDGNENTNENQLVDGIPNTGEPSTDQTQTTSTDGDGQNQEPQLPEISDDDFLKIAKNRFGKEATTVEELWKPEIVEKIVEKEVNPYADLNLDEDDQQYLNYKRETKRSRKDFEALNQDFDKVDALVLARELVRKESGQNLSDEQADAFLERKLDIDLKEPEDFDKTQLAIYTKNFREEKKTEQQKYKQPIAPPAPPVVAPEDEVVHLDNGSTMKKATYEAIVAESQKHVERAIESVNRVAASTFKVVIDEDGTQRELAYSYEPTNEDKQSLVSFVKDISGTMAKEYGVGESFKHDQLNEDRLWMNKEYRERAFSAMLQAARAEAIEELTKAGDNVNYTRSTLQNNQQVKEGVTVVPVADLFKLK